ncbi:MAG: methylenetetrahydrofolate--tRNA-(uracil(54)-C(5))-methyltransferase (FADH(2)-oxidizing) TrmFO [Clostridiales bacterium]|nr:methylenetetrahydrofolate--tRNA-(uracil(54)-C(5))-methyltransferase (FADH(2)-oxidizing) TrmFO [Clostridiales bacterium]
MFEPDITIVGAGLAGSEAAYQASRLGLKVRLYEMKPVRKSPAHHADTFAELVCSNSLRSNQLENGVGLLKEELRILGSLIMEAADKSAVPAGGALAVDREEFSGFITDKILKDPNIEVVYDEIKEIPKEGTVVIATGPLTDGDLYDAIMNLTGHQDMHFFDAAAPIVMENSIDRSICFAMSRYGRGGDDYLNCPMNEEEYKNFYDALVSAELADVKGFDKETVFEGCMPIETMAKRGFDTMRFGPLKPVGLIDPRTGEEPYACVQLRQDDRMASIYNIVGFQTRLKFPEQKRVFSMIPGLQNAEFSRYGVMHRNTYIESPKLLNCFYQMRSEPRIFFAGQITGVEGYIESTASGYLAGYYASLYAIGKESPVEFSPRTMIGAMSHYVSDPNVKHFVPMNANFGLIEPLGYKVKGKKKDKNLAYAARAIEEITKNKDEMSLLWTSN